MSTLSRIRTKVRRLTRSLSDAQITNAQIDEYINDFVLYDFPEHLRLFALRKNFEWVCNANQEFYTTTDTADVEALQNFQNLYITTHQPIYIDGIPAYYSEDRTEFFAQWPLNKTDVTLAQGDGATTDFSGTLSDVPIMQNQVLITAVDTLNESMKAIDDPQDVDNGNLVDPDNSNAILGTINYLTGAYDIAFPSAPEADTDMTAHTLPYEAGRPTSLLYFDNNFTLRPVPDRAYTISMEVYKRPTTLANDSDSPELDQWWQYIAFGAAKKVLEDRTDFEGVARLLPALQEQELLVQRRTIVQQTSQRTATIYESQAGLDAAPWPYGNNNY
ncbi:MAG: hypothetical protein R3230_01435 [Nitrosopumilaceae archaeon]|nr:hypothetical protein [Nitrosopumilaceae archaeon]